MTSKLLDHLQIFEMKYYCRVQHKLVTELVFWYVESLDGVYFKRRKTNEIIKINYMDYMQAREI